MAISDTAFRLAVVFLATVALFFVLYEARTVFAPLVLAVVIGIVLSPLVAIGKRLRLTPVLNALFVLFVAIGVFAVLAILLEPPVSRIVERAPAIWFEVQSVYADVQRDLSAMLPFVETVAQAPGTGGEASENPAIPTWTDALLFAPSIAAQLMIFIGGLFFFLLSRENLYAAVSKVVPRLDRASIVRVERTVSHYFLTITLINLCFGGAVALALTLIGMPSAVLWGVVATAMNFILYLGPLMVALALAVTGILVFDGAAMFLPPLVFVTLNVAEGQFITPALVGRHMRVNPLLVFVSLVFWLWLWGPVGGFVAIPLLLLVLGLWAQSRVDDTEQAPEPAAVAPLAKRGGRRQSGAAIPVSKPVAGRMFEKR